MQRSDFCDYNDAYIAVKATMSVEVTNPINRKNKNLTFKNIGPLDHAYQKLLTDL